jgi:hypothetical protein
VEGGASLGSVRAEKCRRPSPSRIVCDGLIYWRNSQHPHEPLYACLFRGVSVRPGPDGLRGGQAVPEGRCADSVKLPESMIGFH